MSKRKKNLIFNKIEQEILPTLIIFSSRNIFVFSMQRLQLAVSAVVMGVLSVHGVPFTGLHHWTQSGTNYMLFERFGRH